jgi:hypothetical protein
MQKRREVEIESGHSEKSQKIFATRGEKISQL